MHCCEQEGWTALLVATQNGHAACLDLLLKAGVDPNHANKVCHDIIIFRKW